MVEMQVRSPRGKTVYVDWLRVRIIARSVCVVDRDDWPHYMAFAKKAFKFHYNFDQPTADNEVLVLLEEFVLRGLERCALEELAIIAKHKGELAKQLA